MHVLYVELKSDDVKPKELWEQLGATRAFVAYLLKLHHFIEHKAEVPIVEHFLVIQSRQPTKRESRTRDVLHRKEGLNTKFVFSPRNKVVRRKFEQLI